MLTVIHIELVSDFVDKIPAASQASVVNTIITNHGVSNQSTATVIRLK